MKPQKLTKDQIQNTVRTAVMDAIAFIESEVAPDRIKSQEYFDGKVSTEADKDRSKVVATKCRDTLRAVKPSLMRVFLQSASPVEFIPRTPQSVADAEQKTAYAQYVFERNDGFMRLSDAIDDALKKKTGVLKVWREEIEDAEFDEYSGLSAEQVQLVLSDPEVEIVEQEEVDGADPMTGGPLYEIKVSRKNTRGEIKIASVAPEDFFVDRNATNIKDCYVCGHSTEMRVGDVVAMGFDFEEVYDLAGADDQAEKSARMNYSQNDDESMDDPSMRKIILTEAYMKMDIEGVGVPKLYKFICASDKYKILDYELADINPFAVFEVDPEAHAFFGRSLVEIITDDQDAATSLLRGLLDNMNMVNNPRLEVVETQVNLDDVLNNEIGAVLRTKAPGMIRELTVGSMAAGILPAIGYYDDVIRGKTGVSAAGMALNTDALASKSATGVMAAMDQSSQVAELIARYLAEGGMKQLFTIIVALARQNPNPDEMIRVNGSFMPVDPRSWTGDADMMVNVGLGTNKHEERAMALREALQTQMGIWQGFGPSNGMVTMTNIRNTLADILSHSGVHNADRYYSPMDPQIEAQLMQQAQQAQAGQAQGSDPNAAFLQAEQMKVSARVQADMAKTQLDAQKIQMEDDRARDQMAQDLAIKGVELLAKTGVQLNTQALKAEQAAPRPMQPSMGMMPNA